MGLGFMRAKPHAKLERLLLALLLLCYGVGNAYCSTVHDNSRDLHSLLDFKQGITSDPNGVLSSWNTSTHYCRWRGITCTQKRPWRVWGLNLTSQSIAGEITSSLANLTMLSELDLSSNLLAGHIPPLNGHQQLEIIYLNSNSLEGIIPDTLTNCSKLRKLDLSTNHLTGSIPEALWRMPNMVGLFLGINRLVGEIPQSINMSRLQVLVVDFNKLGKALPSNLGIAFPRLKKLYMAHNMFEGQIPASLGNASGLQYVDLPDNNFTGQLMADWGKLSRLITLNFGGNMLESGDIQMWEFFHALRNCSSLTKLFLDQNRLHGVIPNSIGNLSTTLQVLTLGQNDLSGVVPPMGNFHNLFMLGLAGNNLGGSIGDWVGKLKNIQGLYLEVNNFTGPISSSIGNLSRLARLSLAGNEFEGSIPSSIGNLSQLSVLSLSYNNLQGNIPLGIGNLKQLTQLKLSSNKLTGEIPDLLGQCQILEIIQMDTNFLVGGIPT